MSSQQTPNDDPPKTLPEGQTGVWRQVISWVPNRLPSGRVEYAEAGMTWVLDNDDDTGEAESSTTTNKNTRTSPTNCNGEEEESSSTAGQNTRKSPTNENSEDDAEHEEDDEGEKGSTGSVQEREEGTRVETDSSEIEETSSVESWYEISEESRHAESRALIIPSRRELQLIWDARRAAEIARGDGMANETESWEESWYEEDDDDDTDENEDDKEEDEKKMHWGWL